MAAIREVGYRPNPLAQNLRSGQVHLIGLRCPTSPCPMPPILAKTTQRAFSEKGYGSLLRLERRRPRARDGRYPPDAASPRRRAAADADQPGPKAMRDRLAEAVTCPAVLVDRVLPGAPFDCVADDNPQGARLLVQYLHRLGHRRIAVLGGRDGISTSDERIAGAPAAAAEGGHPLDPALVLPDTSARSTLSRRAAVHVAAEPPTAILSINSPQTRGIVRAAQSGLTVPADLSIALRRVPHDRGLGTFDDLAGTRTSTSSPKPPASRLLARLAGAPGRPPAPCASCRASSCGTPARPSAPIWARPGGRLSPDRRAP